MGEAQLLDAIRRAPAEDAPRVAYAELLSKRGDARGEFIVLGCDNAQRRARGDLGDAYVAQTLREWALFREHRSAWLRAMGWVEKKHTWHTWERGFVSAVSTDPEATLDARTALLESPIQRLQISYPRRTDIAKLVGAGVLGAAPHLMIDQISPIEDPLDAEAVRALVAAPALRSVAHLMLALHRFPGELGTITGAPCVSGVRGLRFGETIDAAALLSTVGTWSPALRELAVTTGQIPPDAYQRVLGDPTLQELRDLTLLSYAQNEGDVIARAIATAPLRKLSSLLVMDLSREGFDALAGSPVISGLRSLRLRAVALDGGSMRKLLERAPGIEELSLSAVEIDQNAIDTIAARASGSLRKLVLSTSSNGLDLSPLVASSRYALRGLDLQADGVNDAVAAALAASPFAKSLGSLTFAGPLTEMGARALAASHDLAPGLAILWRMHWKEDGATRAIAKRFPLADHSM